MNNESDRIRWHRLRRINVAIFIAGVIWIAIPAAAFLMHGSTGVEKVLTRFALPIGLVWNTCLLGFLIGWSRKNNHASVWLGLLFIMITAAGNEPLSHWFNAMIEFPANGSSQDSSVQFNTIVLLGGSTRLDHHGTPELAGDGHRLLLAAQLYHARRADNILVTGTSNSLSDDPISPAQAAKRLLMSIGVPADRIQFSGGINTRDEMAQLAQHFEKHGSAKSRIGLITNATHLPRAMRLAKRNGLTFEPLPCLSRGGSAKLSLLGVLPSTNGLVANTDACYELLARMVGQ